VSIDALLSRGDGSDQAVDLRGARSVAVADDELLWVDLVDPSADELDVVTRALALRDESAEALRAPASDPTATVRGDAVEVLVRAPGPNYSDDPVVLQILVGRGWVVTNHERAIPFLEEHREKIQDQREVGLLSPVEFLADLLEWHVDAFLRAAEQLELEVEQLDDAALRTERDLVDRLVAMRRRIAHVRRMLTPHREVYSELTRPDFLPQLGDRDAQALTDAGMRLERALDAIANAREMLIGTFDVHMTRTAQRTNEVMKVLTLASVILLPSVVLAGVMGMNFKVGLFDNPNLFWVVIGVMAVLAIGTVVAARWRGWL
jgi:magnesium/cobalt transport protein CorA